MGERQKMIRKGYYRSTTYMIAVPVIMLFYMKFMQNIPMLGVLPGFGFDIARHCGKFIELDQAPLCKYDGAECFPFGVPVEEKYLRNAGIKVSHRRHRPAPRLLAALAHGR